ncbi:unnamed protein product [Brassica oleracea]
MEEDAIKEGEVMIVVVSLSVTNLILKSIFMHSGLVFSSVV